MVKFGNVGTFVHSYVRTRKNIILIKQYINPKYILIGGWGYLISCLVPFLVLFFVPCMVSFLVLFLFMGVHLSDIGNKQIKKQIHKQIHPPDPLGMATGGRPPPRHS